MTTGETRWEYPDGGGGGLSLNVAKNVDDAMDICTTPPPNVGEQLEMLKKSKDIGKGFFILN